MQNQSPIFHVFNSTLVSGPETLVLPNLVGFQNPIEVLLLQETRNTEGAKRVLDYSKSLGFRTMEFFVKSRLDNAAIKQLASYLSENTPKIIHAHGPKASLYTQRALKKARLSKQVTFFSTHHGVRANDTQLKLKFFELIYEKLTIPKTTKCLTVCTSDRALLIKRGISPKQLEVHLNGVDRPIVPQEKKTAERLLIRSTWEKLLRISLQNDYLVGVVGRLAKEKQYNLILEGFKFFSARNPEANLKILCFGSGPLEGKIKALIKELHIEKNIFLMGYRSNVSYEMNGLDLLISASSAEGLPINLIEAGYAQIPVISHAIDGVNDLIVAEEKDYLIQSPITPEKITAALQFAYSNPDKTADFARRFKSRVIENFSKQAWVNRLKDLYSSYL